MKFEVFGKMSDNAIGIDAIGRLIFGWWELLMGYFGVKMRILVGKLIFWNEDEDWKWWEYREKVNFVGRTIMMGLP